MPSSRPHAIPLVLGLVRQLQPASILDVGVGFGKWGHLFREYTDIAASERDPARYPKSGWKVRIEGIEAFPAYITPAHQYFYDQLHVGPAEQLVPLLGRFELIFLGDVIEHLSKECGEQLLRTVVDRADKAVIVTTPWHWCEQGAACGNEFERHRSAWSAGDFSRYP